jgi:hypothetical protein
MDEELDLINRYGYGIDKIPASDIPWPYNVKTYNPCSQYLPKKEETEVEG